MGKTVWNIEKKGGVVVNIHKEEYNEEGILILMVDYDAFLTLHGIGNTMEIRIWKDLHFNDKGEKAEVSFSETLEVLKKIEYLNKTGAVKARLVD